MSTPSLLNAMTRQVLNTDVDASVSELCWVDVQVTCHVCIVVHWRHAESRRVAAVVKAVVDPWAVDGVTAVCFTQLVKPRNVRSGVIAATVECLMGVSRYRDVLWSTNQRRFNPCVHSCTHARTHAHVSGPLHSGLTCANVAMLTRPQWCSQYFISGWTERSWIEKFLAHI